RGPRRRPRLRRRSSGTSRPDSFLERVESLQPLEGRLVLVDQVAVVLEYHRVVLVAKENTEILDLVGDMLEEVRRERVTKAVHNQPLLPFQLFRLLELHLKARQVNLRGVSVPGFAPRVPENRPLRVLGVQPLYQLACLVVEEPDVLDVLLRAA